ncbi:MAG: arginine repressor [Acidobacteria bacterium]|nr:arginine repressor [Acidobacteriota bacterium]
MKKRRQSAILGLVDHGAVSSQEALRRRLKGLGFSVTQATLSRDLRDLGLVKGTADGAYHRPGAEATNPAQAAARLQHAVAEYLASVDRAVQLVVLRTGPAQAQPLASAIDAAGLEGVVGTIAGDDTVLMVCRDAAAATAVAHRLDAMARRQDEH